MCMYSCRDSDDSINDAGSARHFEVAGRSAEKNRSSSMKASNSFVNDPGSERHFGAAGQTAHRFENTTRDM